MTIQRTRHVSIRIHSTADVSAKATIGESTQIWHQAQVRENAKLGCNCILGKGVYIDESVTIGNNVKIQNYVSVFHGVTIEDGVFIGPHVCFTNDLLPRAIKPDGSLKEANDWVLSKTLIKEGVALGANATIVCGITIGKWAMIGAGSVVTEDIPDFGLVRGNPARLVGFVDPAGQKLLRKGKEGKWVIVSSDKPNEKYKIAQKDWEKVNDQYRTTSDRG